MNCKIYIAATRLHDFPTDSRYVPLMVGKSAPPDWPKNGADDTTGFSISAKNPFFCELTGFYWAWKNDTDSDIKGLCHYRRYLWLNNPPSRTVLRAFPTLKSCDKFLTADNLANLAKEYDCILPKAWAFSADTVGSQFVNAHGEQNLRLIKDALKKISPEYLPTLERVFERRYVYFANIIAARREVFDAYAEWLFAVLFECESRVDLEKPENARLFGYLSERLLNVYVAHNALKIKELPEIFVGGTDIEKDEQRVNFRYIKRRYCPVILKWEEKLRQNVRGLSKKHSDMYRA